MKPKICILADDYPSEGRPVFVFVEQLVNSLVSMDVDIVVIAPQSLTKSLLRRIPVLPLKSTYSTKERKNYKVYRPYSITAGLKYRSIAKLFSFISQIQINRILSKESPNILYGHFWHSAHKMVGYAIKYEKPLFVACGEGDDALEDLVDRMTHKEKILLCKCVRGVISVSSENKRKCIEYKLISPDDIIVLPNCVDDSLFRPTDNIQIRTQLGLNVDDFVISFTGAFIRRKGSRVLSDAIKKINDPQIKLLFMGKPLAGDDCTPDCDNIVYMGTTNHEKLPYYLNASDLFVLPTLKEGCSNAIVEALACGVPVVSSNRPFNYDILNENNSILVDPEDAESVANAIIRLKTDRNLYMKKREYTLKYSDSYSIRERAKKILDFILFKANR